MTPKDRDQGTPRAAPAGETPWIGPTGEASLAHTSQRRPPTSYGQADVAIQRLAQTPFSHVAQEPPDDAQRVNTTLPLVLSMLSVFPCCFGFGIFTGGIGVILSVWAMQDQSTGNYRGARRKAVGAYAVIVVHALLCCIAALIFRIRVH